ncbi:hypothetical protein JCM19235_3036 [Vibrio maritimus]|uniref:Uncharacterized protein n=1 Tax=Vibrio maritimus TaxID=990268 RepID=A0A090S455_9VIBR|nr:hypothetical protein JCM19235_3036 [Vibrio maritimus]
MISLGYGYSAVLMSWLIERFVPQLKDKRTISLAISLLLAVTLGTAHAYLWVSKYLDSMFGRALNHLTAWRHFYGCLFLLLLHARAKK